MQRPATTSRDTGAKADYHRGAARSGDGAEGTGMGEVGLSGKAIIGALKEARIEFIVALPDATMSEHVLWPLSRDDDFKLVRVCKEDEGVSICAGLTSCGRRAALLMQYTGLLDSINAIRIIAVELAQPICMLVGLLAKEPACLWCTRRSIRCASSSRSSARSHRSFLHGEAADVAMLPSAIERAYARSLPLAALVGHRVSP